MADMTFRAGNISYTGSGTYATIKHYKWDSNFIGQVKEGMVGETITFGYPATILPTKSKSSVDKCGSRQEHCLDKETRDIKLDHFTQDTFKIDKCDIEKGAQVMPEVGYANQASEIEYQYLMAEDSEWLSLIESRATETTLAIGGQTPLKSTITSANTLLINMISEAARVFQVPTKELAVGVTSDFYTEVHSLYGSCCYLGANGPEVELGANNLGVKSFYKIPDVFVSGVQGQDDAGTATVIGGFAKDTKVLIYPHMSAIKAYGCQYSGWDDGAGSEANKAFYNRDADYTVDLMKIRKADADYPVLSYVLTTV